MRPLSVSYATSAAGAVVMSPTDRHVLVMTQCHDTETGGQTDRRVAQTVDEKWDRPNATVTRIINAALIKQILALG